MKRKLSSRKHVFTAAVSAIALIILLASASFILSQTVVAQGEWKVEASLDTNGDGTKDLDIRTRDTDGDGKADELHLDFNRNGQIDDGDLAGPGPVTKWGHQRLVFHDPPCTKVWVIFKDKDGNVKKIYWKIRDMNGDGKIDPAKDILDWGYEKPSGIKWYDPPQDLIYIYRREPAPPEEYVGYLDIVKADARNVADAIEFHLTVKGGIPALAYNTFYNVLIDKNNDPKDNCQTYPTHGADTMYSVNLKTGTIERASYRPIGDWWMTQSTAATFGLISAWPDGDTEIIFYVPKNELPTTVEMMVWRAFTDSAPKGVGDLAPDEGLVCLPLTPPNPMVANLQSETLLYGENFTLRARDITFYSERQDILACSFEYSPSLEGPWIEIGTDFDPADLWEVEWRLTGLAEGRYYVRAIMWNTAGEKSSEIITVFIDPTPPMPNFEGLSYGSVVKGLTKLEVVAIDENIRYVEFFYFNDTDKKEKELKALKQTEIGTNPNVQDPYNGKYSCGPTAAAACLAYWGDYKDENGKEPYRNLYNGTDKGLVQMARDLYDLCKTNQDRDKKGTSEKNLVDGINTYIQSKQLGNKLQAKLFERGDWTKAKDEFMSCQDVILLISRPDNSLHWITLASIEKRGQTTDISIMDPWLGAVVAANLKNGKLQSDWNDDGETGDNEFADIKCVVTVCPKDRSACPKDPFIGVDYDGSDGWSVNWNTTQMQDGSYLIYARMVDEDGNEGLSMILLRVQNRLATDLNKDGSVNIIDIAIVARAFWSKPGDPNWNPIADIAEPYGIINILDISKVALDFGKTA